MDKLFYADLSLWRMNKIYRNLHSYMQMEARPKNMKRIKTL